MDRPYTAADVRIAFQAHRLRSIMDSEKLPEVAVLSEHAALAGESLAAYRNRYRYGCRMLDTYDLVISARSSTDPRWTVSEWQRLIVGGPVSMLPAGYVDGRQTWCLVGFGKKVPTDGKTAKRH